MVLFEPDVRSVGLDAMGGTYVTTAFYWDLDDKTRAFAKRFQEKMGRPPTMIQAGDYSAVNHYLKAVKAAGTTDSAAVAAKMKELPVEDFMRRAHGPSDPGSDSDRVVVGALEVSQAEGAVRLDGQEAHLTRTEFRLLWELASAPGRVFSRETLLERVWGYDYFGDTRLVDVHVRRLRTKIEPDPSNPRYVVTVRGLGYKLAP